MGEIYRQGKRTANTQAVCLELSPLRSIPEFPSPHSPPSESVGALNIRAQLRRTWH